MPRPLPVLAVLAIGTIAAGCSSGGDGPSAGAVNQAGSAVPAPDPPIALTTIESAAVADLVGHVPSALGPTAASGSLVGTQVTGSASAGPAPFTGGVTIMQIQPDLKMSNAGSERDLRATLYFDLVDQCRDEDGQILPPEAIEIEFRVDARGSIDRSSVRATAAQPEHEAAARCMVRVIRTADARFAPVRLDEPTRVKTRVPSVD